MRNREQPSLEDALKYVEDFGGFEKAVKHEPLAKWLTYDDYWYHKQCVQIYSDWFLDELIYVQENYESPTVDEFIECFKE